MKSSSTWYDGALYRAFITPLQGEMTCLVVELVPVGSTVIDIGCGPGALALTLSARCSSVVGVDVSPRMIAYADKQRAARDVSNVMFVCGDATSLTISPDLRFTHSTLSLCLHGMAPDTRRAVVTKCRSIAEKLILVDFVSPFPRGLLSVGQTLLEIIEGQASYRNFRDWQQRGGIDSFIDRMGLTVVEERRWSNGFGKAVLVHA